MFAVAVMRLDTYDGPLPNCTRCIRTQSVGAAMLNKQPVQVS